MCRPPGARKTWLSAVFLVAASRILAQAAPPQVPATGAPRPQGPQIGVPTLGMPYVHDPSTVVRFHGQYYVYTTGRGIPFITSPDGVTWTRQGSVFTQLPEKIQAAVPMNKNADVWAPDIVRVGDQFYLYYAVSSWGSFQSVVALATNPTLDPKDPAYKWTDRGVVASSDGKEDLNAIDPGVIFAPDGTLWICYGSYHGSIRIIQLDPKTGLALHPDQVGDATVISRQSEGSDIIFHDGYYYLFVNHNSCCKGKDSEYNIRVGRSRTITGPYLDRHNQPLANGGGSLFLAAHDHRIGPGHFGRLLDYDASPNAASNEPERFSIHYEADLTRGGRSTLDIRPLLWSPDGWPIAGDNLTEGAYQIVSRMSENTLESHTPAPPKPATPAGPAPAASAPTPPTPTGPATPHLGRYLSLDNQKWTIAPAAGGLYKIVDLASGDALEVPANATGEASVDFAPYTGAESQLWALDEFPDGSYRIANKATGLALTESSGGAVTASQFTRDDRHLWTITTP